MEFTKYSLQNIFSFIDTRNQFFKLRLVSKTFDAAVFETRKSELSTFTIRLDQLKNV
jgi:hypothetical protein